MWIGRENLVYDFQSKGHWTKDLEYERIKKIEVELRYLVAKGFEGGL